MFEELKKELLIKAKEQDACSDQYRRAEKSANEEELLKVIYDNIEWCVGHKIVSHEYFSKFNADVFTQSGLVNTGKENTGFINSGDSNSGYRNSGNWNSGNWNSGNSNSGNSNSGYRNSGDSNSGNWNSGNWNSGDSNSGNWNSGNWNSGNWNSGDSNSGYRNSGAFCLDTNPKVWLFDKPTNINVRDWENSRPYRIMADYLNFTFWINASEMTEQEKKDNPKYETTEGYLKTIPYKEGWSNMWGNLNDNDKKEFTSLPNFNSETFESITGIKI